MELISGETTHEISAILCVPFINLPPSSLTAIYSALHFAHEQCHKMKQSICFVIFYQPLYIKARSIVAQIGNITNINVVIRLGGFHMLMSFLGCIGFIMEGRGSEELWSVAYAPNSVKQMMTGHSFSRAVRAHILTYTALGIVMCRSTNIENPAETIRHLQKLLGGPAEEGHIDSDTVIRQLTDFLETTMEKLKSRGPTAELWMQYFEYVNIVLQFIEAERLGRWKLHLQCVKAMIPIFHATGRVAYAKCAQVYLQDMLQLQSTMKPMEYKKFTADGYFTIRRSDKHFSGIWTDMTIEQTLNRLFSIDIESRRGITEGVVARFLQEMPSMYAVLEALEDFTGVTTSKSEQHKDINESRQKRDSEDVARFVFWLTEKDIFDTNEDLYSLTAGVVAGPSINCHRAFELGTQSMFTVVGKTFDAVKISFANKIKPLGSIRATMKDCDDTYCPVDSTLLFQKSSLLFQDNEDVTKEALKCKLAPYPLSFFTPNGFMRKCVKSTLYKCFTATKNPLSDFVYVIDGGFLLRKVVWQHNSTFRDIFQQYVGYIRANYKECVVVFDGYRKKNIDVKSYERFQRKGKLVSADLKITPSTLLSISQSQFLSNVGNKNEFVTFLSRHLEFNGIRTKIAKEDANTVIINTAVESSMPHNNVVVVGNDVDLLLLAIALCPPNKCIHFQKVVSHKREVLYSTDDHHHLKPYILFLHAFSGCDTTSAILRKGKNSLHKLLLDNPVFQDYAKRFYDENASGEELYEAGEAIIMILYGSCTALSILEDLRYERFQRNVASASAQVKLASLPPTKSALLNHIRRVYYQIQLWLGREINPGDWGWKKTKTMYIPVAMNVEPALSSLLSKVHKEMSCGCKNNCSGNRCSCRKAGINCSAICKHCSGTICKNSKKERINVNVALDDEAVELDEEVDTNDTDTSDTEVQEEVEEAEENDYETGSDPWDEEQS